MDDDERPLSASKLGREHGLTGEEMNRVLADKGLLEGEPGAYSLTEAGEKYGAEKHHDNGYGGYAARDWSTTSYSPQIRDELEISDEEKQQARDAVRERRTAQAAERQRISDEYHGHGDADTSSEPTAEPPTWPKIVLIATTVLVALGGAALVNKYRERRDKKRAAAESTANQPTPHDASALDDPEPEDGSSPDGAKQT